MSNYYVLLCAVILVLSFIPKSNEAAAIDVQVLDYFLENNNTNPLHFDFWYELVKSNLPIISIASGFL